MNEKKLLVVDDDKAVGDLIRRISVKQGFETLVLLDSVKFQEICESFDPDVILLDIVMPNADGVELLRYLAKSRSRARIIFISGYGANYLSTAERLSEAHGLESVRALAKPIDIQELRDALAGDSVDSAPPQFG